MTAHDVRAVTSKQARAHRLPPTTTLAATTTLQVLLLPSLLFAAAVLTAVALSRVRSEAAMPPPLACSRVYAAAPLQAAGPCVAS